MPSRHTWKDEISAVGWPGLLFAGYVVCALLAPWLAPFDPLAMNPDQPLSPPGWPHVFGTDQFGRDILSRVIYGCRSSLIIALSSVSLALVAGSLLGALAGFRGGWVDGVIGRFFDVMFSFPDILLALGIMAVLGADWKHLVLAIGVVYTPIFGRVARSAIQTVKGADYVTAARAIGAPPARIVRRHLLPQTVAPLIVQTTLSFAFAILAEAALSYLGLGGEPDQPLWGLMLRDGKDWLARAPWVSVFPGIAISLTVLAFNLTGDRLRDRLDPRVQS